MSTDLCAAEIFATAKRMKLPLESGQITTGSNGFPDRENGKCRPWEIGESTGLSAWSESAAKRFFDQVCVLAALPVLMPALLLVALAVRLTSRGPVLFLQKRVGRHGRPFTILKFRTLQDLGGGDAAGQRFTPVGRFLRRSKLDEMPQFLNVLAGHMSLVGPRPKMREYQLGNPTSKPGITGAATIAFACEEELLERVAALRSWDTYREVVMPAKHQMDAEYMAQATFVSDLKLILNTLLRRWDPKALQNAIGTASPLERAEEAPGNSLRRAPRPRGPSLPKMARTVEAEAALPS